MTTAIDKICIRYEQDVVFCRQRFRQIAKLLGYDNQDQTRIATAVSEIARNAFKYSGGGTAFFALEEGRPDALTVTISDNGPGIGNLDEVLGGTYRSATGMGMGILGAKRLMDQFHIRSQPGRGTTVILRKVLPVHLFPDSKRAVERITEELSQVKPQGPLEEIRQQNQELIEALEEVRRQKEQLVKLNRELEETNTGVVALYAELDEKASSLQLANDLKTRFIANMSHEFRTPLNSVLALTKMLLDRLDGELTIEQERQVQFIRRATEELYYLVNDLLDIAKIEAGKTTIRIESFDVRELFSALLGMFRPFLHDNQKVFLIFAPPASAIAVQSDRGKLAQILRNLISNALKFTNQGSVKVSARAESENICFQVVDTGIGIDPKDQARVFEEFIQLESSLQRQVKGTGLGLPLARKLSLLLGGGLDLKSVLGQGSTFRVWVPRTYRKPERSAEEEIERQKLGFLPTQSVSAALKEIQDAAPHGIMEKKLEELQRRSSSEKILIVDDNEIARYILNDILMDEGYLTIEADSGPEGIRLAREHQPKAIFLDLVMPGMDGNAVLECLSTDPLTKHIPVIVNTSKLLGEDEFRKLSTAAAAIVLKDMPTRQSAATRIREALKGAGLRKTGT